MSNSFNSFLFNFNVADLSFSHKKGIWKIILLAQTFCSFDNNVGDDDDDEQGT